MALNLKNAEVERLAADVVAVTGETLTEAVRKALQERLERLRYRIVESDRRARLVRFLEEEAWPIVPPDELGRRWSRQEEDALLGFGEDGS